MKARNLMVTILCILGFSSIITGSYLEMIKEEPEIEKKEEQKEKEITLTLKKRTIEQDELLSGNVQEYIEEELSKNTLKELVLDINGVDTKTKGTYEYRITYKEKIYKGEIIVTEKEKEEKNLLAHITTKNVQVEKDQSLSIDLTTYIEEELTEEMKEQMVLDLTNVDSTTIGDYQYKITYRNKTYIGNIRIIEKEQEKEKEKKED